MFQFNSDATKVIMMTRFGGLSWNIIIYEAINGNFIKIFRENTVMLSINSVAYLDEKNDSLFILDIRTESFPIYGGLDVAGRPVLTGTNTNYY